MELCFIDAANIQTAVMSDLPLLTVNGKSKGAKMILKICANSTPYLVNTANSDKEATITHGSLLVGFGKGKWQTSNAGNTRDIKYELNNEFDAVIFNGNVTTLGTLVAAKRPTTEADVGRVFYHDIIDNPSRSDKSAFYLRPTQDVFYSLSDVAVKREAAQDAARTTQSIAASLLPPEQWNTEYTKLHWIVKMDGQKRIATDTSADHLDL